MGDVLERVKFHRGVGVPLLWQSAVFNAMFYVDSFVLGFVGPREVAAVSAGAQVAWLYEAFIACAAYVGGTLVGRLAGAGREPETRAVVHHGYVATAVLAAAIGIPSFVLANQIAGLMIADAATADLMASYLRWSIAAYTLSTFGMVVETALQNLKEQRFVLHVYAAEFTLKLVVTLVLVFGFGLGLAGVVASLLAAKALRLVLLLHGARTRLPRLRASGRPADYGWSVFATQAAPLALSVLIWNVSTLVISSGFGQLPIEQYAAYSVLNNAMYLLLIPTEAYTKTVAILVARLLGSPLGRDQRALSDRLRDVTLAGVVLALATAVASAVYALLLPLVQPSLGGAVQDTLLDLAVPFACLVFTKSVTDSLTEGVLRPTFKNRFLLWVEVAALPVTVVIFHIGDIDVVSGFWYLVLLEGLRMALVFGRQRHWLRNEVVQEAT
ncbi:MATE family efflux transporter [Nocardioides sp. NPDC023903]|uniref:MATE family efflux transporter n=1 Tax=Nocardioides sp. NPDC023903 TaxID=3157195 RepID=UPI0033D07ACE